MVANFRGAWSRWNNLVKAVVARLSAKPNSPSLAETNKIVLDEPQDAAKIVPIVIHIALVRIFSGTNFQDSALGGNQPGRFHPGNSGKPRTVSPVTPKVVT